MSELNLEASDSGASFHADWTSEQACVAAIAVKLIPLQSLAAAIVAEGISVKEIVDTVRESGVDAGVMSKALTVATSEYLASVGGDND